MEIGKDAIGQTMTMRYRMSTKDAFYGGGLVNGARSVTYQLDVAERLMVKLFGNTGDCRSVQKIRFYAPVHSGDYLEFHARVLDLEDDLVTIEIRSFKIAILPEAPPFDSSIDILAKPTISVASIVQYTPME